MDYSYLNVGQLNVVQEAYKWYHYTDDPVFQFEGPPGTGKSVVLNYIAKTLDPEGNKSAAAAYTGAAAIVLRTKGFPLAKTLHSLLFNPVQEIIYDDKGNIATHNYFETPLYEIGFEPKSLEGVELLFIDEGGMVPRWIRNEIESRGIRVVVCGDIRQLPTVDDEPGYLVDGLIHHLTEIMRQEANNAIIWLSNRAINGLPIHKGCYGNVLVIDYEELNDRMIAAADVVLCGKNETRDQLNNRVRHNILGIDDPFPKFGERLICRKNNWNKDIGGISLANGLVGSVSNYPDVSGFDGKTFTIDFTPNILGIPFSDLHVDYEYFTAPFNIRKMLKNNKYNMGEKMEFAYALTTHLSQGSEWSSGIYMEEYLNKDINNNLNYVGITRFRDYCIWVKPKRKTYYNLNKNVQQK